MILYHGSSVGNRKKLDPFVSEHKKPYVYLTSNPVVALLYTVKAVPKPFSFYPYGFDGDSAVVYSEYYDHCFSDIYRGKKGFLYLCRSVRKAENPTNINSVYACEFPVWPDACIEIADVYLKLMEFKEKGLFKIKPFHAVSKQEMRYVYEDMRNTMKRYHLKAVPENPMSIFIKTHFPAVWRETLPSTAD